MKDRRLLATRSSPPPVLTSHHHHYHSKMGALLSIPILAGGLGSLGSTLCTGCTVFMGQSPFSLLPLEEGARTDIQAVQQLQQCANHVIAIHQ